MAQNRKRKSLYEVIGSRRSKSRYSRTLERFEPAEFDEKPPAEDAITPPSRPTVQWPGRPRLVQFNAGRLEISMPYPAVIAIFLALVLLGLLLFQLGQNFSIQKTADSGKTPKPVQKATIQPPADTTQAPAVVKKISQNKTGSAESKASNRIVIQTWSSRTQLEPVKSYFAENGIKTEIRKIGDVYYLITIEKYENPQRLGTDGYLARQKIVEIGAEYKAPPGYGSFGPKPFYDAYGMRFDD